MTDTLHKEACTCLLYLPEIDIKIFKQNWINLNSIAVISQKDINIATNTSSLQKL